MIIQDIVTSSNNDAVKYLKKLYQTSKRKRKGKFILEGYRIIDEALKYNTDFDMLFMTPEFGQSEKGEYINNKLGSKVTVKYISEDLLQQVADTVTPQGIIAIVKKVSYNLDNFKSNLDNILVLDRVQDPGNMGTLIRTAAAAGVDGIITLKGSVDIYNLKVLRATMGAIFSIPIIDKMELSELKELIHSTERDYQIVCAEPTATDYYFESKYKSPVLLVIGNEAHGVREELISLSDYLVKIPLNNNVESLNAAMAGGILLYNIMYGN